MNDHNPPVITLKGVNRSFGGRDVLKNVSFEVASGEALCLLGRSGTGKSVTLKLIIGLIKPDSGAVCVAGQNIVDMDEDGLSKVRSRMGFLFQSGALFDSLSLYENLALPLKRLRPGTPRDEITAIVQKNLEDVGLGKDGNKMPMELSGGMRKRAGLARSLMLDPQILLVDEPISGLDRVTASEIDDLLLQVKEKHRPAMVIVTHDTHEARRVGDRVAVLDNGSLIGVGRMDELAQSANALVRALVSQSGIAMRIHTWAIGLFIIVGTALFATVLFLIGNRHDVFGNHAEFYSEFADIGGLPNGAEVRVSGFEAGEVKGIQVPSGRNSKFRLKLQVQAGTRGMVRSDSVVSIKTEGIVGDKYISIQAGTKNAPAARDGATLPSREPVDMGAMLERSSALLNNVDESVTDLRGRLDVALDSVTKTVTDVDGVVSTVRPDIRNMTANASRITGTLSDIVADLEAGRGPAGLFLKDADTRQQLQATVSNIRAASENLKDASARGDRVIADVESRDLASSVKATLDNVQALSTELRADVARALGPDDLGDDGATNIRETLSNLSRGTGNLADDTEALKHEFFFRGFFKKRGFYDLDHLAPADYMKACEQGPSCRSRKWLDEPGLFASGNEGKERLTETGRGEIDRAVAPFVGSLPNRIVIVEGYCSVGTADQQFVAARKRAELVREYLEEHFHLLHRDVGVVPLGDTPPRNAGRSVWNGVGIVFLEERAK